MELQARSKAARIIIGNNVSTNNNLLICSCNNIKIGDDCLVGQSVTLMGFEAHGIAPNTRMEPGIIGNIVTGNNVWIGNNVSILKNSGIGNNSILATGAVFTRKFPKNVIIDGVPAKIIKEIN